MLPPTAIPLSGDAVLYGTCPWSTATSLHVGLVVQVWPDGAIVTIEGDAGPAPIGLAGRGHQRPLPAVAVETYNGFPIYAFAAP